MTAILKVDTIQDTAGNNIINESSDTITIGASGDTTNIIGTLQNNGAAVASTNGITSADQWRLTTSFQGDVNPIASNLERADQSGWGRIEPGMSQSSGVFTFPSTGIWKVEFNVMSYYSGENRYTTAVIQATTNNSSYVDQANSDSGWSGNTSNVYGNSFTQTLVDVTDTSNVKVSFRVDVEDSSTSTQGDSTKSRTYMMFTRLGDT